MKKYRWQILIFVIALIAIAVLLLKQPEPIQELIPEIIGETDTPGMYTEALVGDIIRLNPLMDETNQVDKEINRLLYSSLIKFDYRGNPQPDLAIEWGISYDGLNYNITIRQDVFWHDGEQVTTEDVAFTIGLLSQQGFDLPEDVRAMWENVEVLVYDDFNFKLEIPESFSPFLDYLNFGILPEHILGAYSVPELLTAQFNLAPIGSGPFKFDELTTSGGEITGVVLTAFDEYYEGRPLIDQVEFRLYESFDAAWQAYQDGEVLGIGEVPYDTVETVSKDTSVGLYNSPLPEVVTIVLNLDENDMSFLQNAEVRKAMLMGINRSTLVTQNLLGEAVVVHSPILAGTWAYYDAIEKYEYDKQAAIDLLIGEEYVIPAEGGNIRAREGEEMALTLLHEDTELMTAVALSIQRYWSALGISVDLQSVSVSEMMDEHLAIRDFDAALVTYDYSDTPDPDPYPFWHESQVTNGQNYSGWTDRHTSEYIESARTSTLRSERERLYKNFQIHFTLNMPALLLYQPIYTFMVSDQIGGVTVGPIYDPADRFNDIEQWYIITDETMEASETP